MGIFRVIFLVLLLAAAGCFVCFLVTGQPRYKHYGLRILQWTMGAAFFFFAVLAVERFF